MQSWNLKLIQFTFLPCSGEENAKAEESKPAEPEVNLIWTLFTYIDRISNLKYETERASSRKFGKWVTEKDMLNTKEENMCFF